MTFKVCNMVQSCPIYYIKWALLILNLAPLYLTYQFWIDIQDVNSKTQHRIHPFIAKATIYGGQQ